MNVALKNRRVKMPQKARFPKCPECLTPKQAHEFRTSNRNPARHKFCYQCRKQNPNLAIKPALELTGIKRNESFLTIKRRNSKFRTLFHAMAKSLFIRRKRRKRKEVWMGVKEQTNSYLKFPERVAAIVGKTFSERGDDFKLADDEALTRIRDLLIELDPTLIERNKNKRLSR